MQPGPHCTDCALEGWDTTFLPVSPSRREETAMTGSPQSSAATAIICIQRGLIAKLRLIETRTFSCLNLLLQAKVLFAAAALWLFQKGGQREVRVMLAWTSCQQLRCRLTRPSTVAEGQVRLKSSLDVSACCSCVPATFLTESDPSASGWRLQRLLPGLHDGSGSAETHCCGKNEGCLKLLDVLVTLRPLSHHNSRKLVPLHPEWIMN